MIYQLYNHPESTFTYSFLVNNLLVGMFNGPPVQYTFHKVGAHDYVNHGRECAGDPL